MYYAIGALHGFAMCAHFCNNIYYSHPWWDDDDDDAECPNVTGKQGGDPQCEDCPGLRNDGEPGTVQWSIRAPQPAQPGCSLRSLQLLSTLVKQQNSNTPFLLTIQLYICKGRFQIKKQKKCREFSLTGGGGHPNSLPILLLIL